ncbi:MAG: hypothetical protein U7126_06860 [Microcoleus sp.]
MPKSTLNSTLPLVQVESDAKLKNIWLHGRSPETQRADRGYLADFAALMGGKSLMQLMVNGIQLYQDNGADPIALFGQGSQLHPCVFG